MAIKLKVQSDPNIGLGVQDTRVRFGLSDQIQVVQSGDYNDLENKPSINGVTLEGNKTTEDLGIQAGVTSWNGQTGDVTYTPPDYVLTYDELSSVGYAKVGEAETAEPNYTPSGTVTGSVTTSAETFMSGGTVTLESTYSNYKLILGTNFTPTTTTKSIVTGIGNLTFNGNGVKFAVEQEN